MGQETYHVSLNNVFGQNRRKLCKALQQKPVSEGNLVVYLHGGPSETRFDSDHEPLFRQESYFWYLTGVKEPDCAIAIDVATQHATLFIPNLPASYATIMGRIKTREEWKEHYQVGEVLFTDDVEDTLAGMLEKRSNGTKSKLCTCFMR
jgi:Xaa-Pro dipeptidase